MISFDEFWKLMNEVHQKYCNLTCFTKDDVVNAILCKLLCEPFVKEEHGTTIITTWGSVFGNLSYLHFIESFNEALHRFEVICNE